MKKTVIILLSVLLVSIISFSILYYIDVNINEDDKVRYRELISQGDKELELLTFGYAKGSEYYINAIEIDDTQLYPYTKLLDILILKKQYGKALELISKAKRTVVKEEICPLYVTLADSYFNSREYKSAINNYVECYDSSKGDYSKLYSSISFLRQGNISKAEEIVNGVSNSDINLYSYAKLVKAYIKSEKQDESKGIVNEIDLTAITDDSLKKKIEKYKTLINKTYTDEKYYKTVLSTYLLNEEIPSLSVKYLEQYVDGLDEYYDGSLVLSQSYYEIKDYEKAINTQLKTSTLENRYEGYLVLARSYRETNEQASAISNYKEAYQHSKSPERDSVLSEYVEYLVNTNQVTLAEKEINTYLSKENNENINFQLLKLYSIQNKIAEFAKPLSNLSKMKISDAEKKKYLGYKILYNLEAKKYAIVREDLQALVKLDRNNPEYYILSARLELNDGDKEKAKEYLFKAMDFVLVGSVSKIAITVLVRVK